MNHVINLRPINHFNVIAILMLSLALPAEGNEDDLYFSAVNHPERLNSYFA
jgi:predicted methyltransferase